MPESLRRNAPKWTRELMSAVRRFRRGGGKVPDRLFNRYKKTDVRAALGRMYRGLCCYCEVRIGVVAVEQIEHRRPKRRFPEYTYAWDNLHLVCPNCNLAKLQLWVAAAEILDAVADPVEDHLTYRRSPLVKRWPLTPRGETTVDLAGLNRPKLLRARTNIYLRVMQAVSEIRRARQRAGNTAEVRAHKRELLMKCQGQFGSLVAFTIAEEFGSGNAAA